MTPDQTPALDAEPVDPKQDPYRMIAAAANQITPEQVTDEQRAAAKAASFANRFQGDGRMSILDMGMALLIASGVADVRVAGESHEDGIARRERMKRESQERSARAEEIRLRNEAERFVANEKAAAPFRLVNELRAKINRIKQGPRATRAHAMQEFVAAFNNQQIKATIAGRGVLPEDVTEMVIDLTGYPLIIATKIITFPDGDRKVETEWQASGKPGSFPFLFDTDLVNLPPETPP